MTTLITSLVSGDTKKELYSIISAFLIGFLPVWTVGPAKPAIIAGLAGVAAYLGGYVQKNPRNQPTTPDELIRAAQASPVIPPVMVDAIDNAVQSVAKRS